jgi:hypothetical protein
VWKEAGSKAEVIRTQIFQIHANLLSNESHQPWDKIVKAQTETAPGIELKGEVHNEKRGKTWESFLHCMTFHLLTMFQHISGEVMKYVITNVLKKPN